MAFENAKFIWLQNEIVDQYMESYDELIYNGKGAICQISCDGDYTLFINGVYVASGQYGDFEDYKIYDEIDITSYLTVGKNHFSVVCHHTGKDFQRYKKYKAGLIYQVTEGEGISLVSDERTLVRQSVTFESGRAKQISSQLGFSYKYDSTKEDLWTRGQLFDFENATVTEKSCIFYKRPIPKHSLIKMALGNMIYEGQGYTVYDLGKEYVGLFSVELECDEPTDVIFAYGEHLENCRVVRKMGDRDFSIEYKARAGVNKHTSYMLRFACRYLEIQTQGKVKVNKIGIIPQVYPVKRVSKKLPNNALSDIYDICLNTLELCMMEHYVDCPWREQCLYAFDSRNQMLCGYYGFEGGNYEYARANLLLMSKDRREDELLSICFPSGTDLTIPSFSLYYILSVLEYTTHSGDLTLAKEVNHKLRLILNAVIGNMKGDLACRFEGKEHWNFYDWSQGNEGKIFASEARQPNPMLSMLLIMALNSYEKLCQMCELDFGYSYLAKKIAISLKERYFDKEKGLWFIDEKDGLYTELLNSFAVSFGVSTGSEAEKICKALVSSSLLPSSLSTKCFKYDGLIKTNKDAYKDYILSDIEKTYNPMIETGTVWETAEGKSSFGGAGSLCHGWSSIPIYYFNLLLD